MGLKPRADEAWFRRDELGEQARSAGKVRAIRCRQCAGRLELAGVPPMACPSCGLVTRGHVSKAEYILDTNVIVDMVTVVDLTRDAKEKGGLDNPKVQMRRRRARAGLLLAWHFHQHGIATGSHPQEVRARILKLVPPEDDDHDSVYVTLFFHFLRERVISGWGFGGLNVFAADSEPLTGTQVDDALLALAIKEGVPLVTNEGFGRGKLRRKAKKQGHGSYSSEDLVAELVCDPKQAALEFLAAFDDAVVQHLRDSDAPGSYLCENLKAMRSIYGWVLEVE